MTSEGKIQREIMDLLDAKGLFHWRSEPVSRHGRKAHPSTIGMPDIFILYKGLLYGMEIKTVTGKPSEEQLAWGRRLEAAGGSFYIVRSVEEVLTIIEKTSKK